MRRRKLSKEKEKLLRLFTPRRGDRVRPLWRWDFLDRIITCAIKGGASGDDLARLWGAISELEITEAESISEKARRTANLTPYQSHLTREQYFAQRGPAVTMEDLAARCTFQSVQGLREWEKKNLKGKERMETRALLRTNRQRKP